MSDDKIINSQTLKEDVERESGKPLIESNSGSTRYSGRDNSYSNLFDFFIKVGRTKSTEGSTEWSRLTGKEKTWIVLKAVVTLLVMICFLAFAIYVGGRVGLVIGIAFVFALWMLMHHISRRTDKKVDKRRK